MMGALASVVWIAVVVPVAIALLLALFGGTWRRAVPFIAAIGPVLTLALGAASLASIPSGAPSTAAPWTSALAAQGSLTWFRVGDMSLSVGWSVDSLAAIMLLVVGFVALMVMWFSAGYMAEDRGWVRYYALLSLFTGSMTLLVIGDSFTSLFIGWELVGVCSSLLIGFWYQKPAAAAAAVKAFLTSRVGDVGLMRGIAVLWHATKSLGYEGVLGQVGSIAPATVTAAAILVAIGAIGKSAQFPLHAWLPDAMEGPTPVSALIHAATMVAAGVYLVARVWPIFALAGPARTLLLVVGVVSALGAALIAVAQSDIKRVLAYSTISQLGFMFAALGAGAWEVAFVHLVSHAAFKALLFLASGSVIHGSGTQDMREMGGLRKTMPWTFGVWLVGVASLVGIPPAAGFFSKHAIIDAVWTRQPAVGVLLVATVFVTGLYALRATKLAFFGSERGSRSAHESSWTMLAPLLVLAVPAAGLGVGGGWMVGALGGHPEPLSAGLSALAVAAGLAGGAIAWFARTEATSAAAEMRPLARMRGAAASGFGWDMAIDRIIVNPTVGAARTLWAVADRFVIDGLVEGSALGARKLGAWISRLQTGDGQGYAALMAVATLMMLASMILLGR